MNYIQYMLSPSEPIETKEREDNKLQPHDYLTLASIAGDLGALGLSLTGFSPAAVAAGAASTTAQLIGDIKRDGFQWKDAGRALLGYGLDAASLIPFGGATAQMAKLAPKLAKAAPIILGLGTATLSSMGIASAVPAFKKVANGEKLTMDDYRMMMNALQSVVGLGRQGKGVYEWQKNKLSKPITYASSDNAAATRGIEAESTPLFINPVTKTGTKGLPSGKARLTLTETPKRLALPHSNPVKSLGEEMVRLYRATGTSGDFKPSVDGGPDFYGMWFTTDPTKISKYASQAIKDAKKAGKPNPIEMQVVEIPKSLLELYKASNIADKSKVEFEPEDFLIPRDFPRRSIPLEGYTGNILTDSRIPLPEIDSYMTRSKLDNSEISKNSDQVFAIEEALQRGLSKGMKIRTSEGTIVEVNPYEGEFLKDFVSVAPKILTYPKSSAYLERVRRAKLFHENQLPEVQKSKLDLQGEPALSQNNYTTSDFDYIGLARRDRITTPDGHWKYRTNIRLNQDLIPTKSKLIEVMGHEIGGHALSGSISALAPKEVRRMLHDYKLQGLAESDVDDVLKDVLANDGSAKVSHLVTQELQHPHVSKMMRYNQRVADETLMPTVLGRLAKNNDIDGIKKYFRAKGVPDSQLEKEAAAAILRYKYVSNIQELSTRANAGYVSAHVNGKSTPDYTWDLQRLEEFWTPGSLRLFQSKMIMKNGGRVNYFAYSI